jgi:hypothetical protein
MAFSQHRHVKKPAQRSSRVGRFPVNASDITGSSATTAMTQKLELLFAHKRRLVLSDAFGQLTPLLLLAKSPDLRKSLQTVMPEKLAQPSAGDVHLDQRSSVHSVSSTEEDEQQELGSRLHALGKDASTAKSVVRLSNAILPLLKFYEQNAPPLKQALSPSKANKKKGASQQSASNGTSSLATTAVVGASVNMQEVHHAFHSLLRHIQSLESSCSAGSTDTLHSATAATVTKPEPPVPLVDAMMNVSQWMWVDAYDEQWVLKVLSYRRITRRFMHISRHWRSSCMPCRTGTAAHESC